MTDEPSSITAVRGAEWAARPIEPDELDRIDPLDRHGMRAGDTSLDHGTFRAAGAVTPPDLRASTLIAVPAGDVAPVPEPLPASIDGVVYARVEVRPDVSDAGTLELRADVLQPDVSTSSRSEPFPIVVFVPGGGFVQSPRSGALLRRAVVAAAGFVVVSIEYRTLRHGVALDGADDVAAAVAWACARAAELGGDADRVGLWGESAGGYLAALAVTTGRTTDVRCVVDTFGLTDLSRVAMDFDDEEQARHRTAEITEAKYVLGRHSGRTIDDDPEEMQRADPVARVTGSEPPFLIFHGAADGLVSPGQTQLLHRALLDHGVDSRRFVVDGAGHYGPEWSSRTVLDIVIEHLHAHLTHRSDGSIVRTGGRSSGGAVDGSDPRGDRT